MKQIALIGGGGHAKVIAEIIEEAGGSIASIQDNDVSVTSVIGYPVTTEMPPVENEVIVSIGNNHIRRKVALEIGNAAATAIHPRATLSPRCSIGGGTVVMAGVTINSDTVVGRHCIINTNASVDHDCVIGDFVHVAPGSAIAGGVRIGEGTLVGIGSTIVPGVTVGRWATIGAGAVVIADVPDYAVVVGVPADIIKYNQ